MCSSSKQPEDVLQSLSVAGRNCVLCSSPPACKCVDAHALLTRMATLSCQEDMLKQVGKHEETRQKLTLTSLLQMTSPFLLRQRCRVMWARMRCA